MTDLDEGRMRPQISQEANGSAIEECRFHIGLADFSYSLVRQLSIQFIKAGELLHQSLNTTMPANQSPDRPRLSVSARLGIVGSVAGILTVLFFIRLYR